MFSDFQSTEMIWEIVGVFVSIHAISHTHAMRFLFSRKISGERLVICVTRGDVVLSSSVARSSEKVIATDKLSSLAQGHKAVFCPEAEFQ